MTALHLRALELLAALPDAVMGDVVEYLSKILDDAEATASNNIPIKDRKQEEM